MRLSIRRSDRLKRKQHETAENADLLFDDVEHDVDERRRELDCGVAVDIGTDDEGTVGQRVEHRGARERITEETVLGVQVERDLDLIQPTKQLVGHRDIDNVAAGIG